MSLINNYIAVIVNYNSGGLLNKSRDVGSSKLKKIEDARNETGKFVKSETKSLSPFGLDKVVILALI